MFLYESIYTNIDHFFFFILLIFIWILNLKDWIVIAFIVQRFIIDLKFLQIE